jgi:hypothetical protein
MPPPFYGADGKAAHHKLVDSVWTPEFRDMITLIVLTLSWMHVDRKAQCPTSARAGQSLTDAQVEAVFRLAKLCGAWAKVQPLSKENLGRSAAKLPDLQDILLRMSSMAETLKKSLDP